MARFSRKYNPSSDDPSSEELEGRANLEKNDFLALVIAAFTVFMPVLLLFIGALLLIIFVLFL